MQNRFIRSSKIKVPTLSQNAREGWGPPIDSHFETARLTRDRLFFHVFQNAENRVHHFLIHSAIGASSFGQWH